MVRFFHPRAFGKATRLGGLALLGLCALGVSASGAAAEGLFDFLFRPHRPAQVVAYAPDPMPGFGRSLPGREQQLHHRSASRAQRFRPDAAMNEAIDKTFGDKPKKTQAPIVGKGPLGPFMNDPTLRAGDVVVTEAGLMVYRGGGGSHHAAVDFVNLSRSGSKGEQLAAIERANKWGKATMTVAEPARPAQTASAAQAKH